MAATQRLFRNRYVEMLVPVTGVVGQLVWATASTLGLIGMSLGVANHVAHYVEIKCARLRSNRSQSRARSDAIDGIHDRDRLHSKILLKCLNRSGYQSIAFGIIIIIMFVIVIDYADYVRPSSAMPASECLNSTWYALEVHSEL